jgi:hypothetical protein
MPLSGRGALGIIQIDHGTANKIANLGGQFDEIVEQLVQTRGLRSAVVRTALSINTTVVLDQARIWFLCERAHGTANVSFIDRGTDQFTTEEMMEAAVWEVGYQDPFVIALDRDLLDMESQARVGRLTQRAIDWVDGETRRVEVISQLVRMEPIFGQPMVLPNPRLCFVIAPFNAERTKVYEDIIRPTVVSNGLAPARADEIAENRAVMDNIWRSICSARMVIADISQPNANAFYELGIAHTGGKDTILLEERPTTGEPVKRPFDTYHLRRVIYPNDATGGAYLQRALDKSIKWILGKGILTKTT